MNSEVYLYSLFLGIAGMLLASFFGVIISRLHELSLSNIISVLIGRSQCESCHHILRRWQLIPLYGYIRQSGKCYDCTAKIPGWMTGFEVIVGLLRGCVYIYSGDIGLTIYIGGVSALLLGLVIADILFLELHLVLFALWCSMITGYHIYTHLLAETRIWAMSLLAGFLLLYLIGRWIAYRKFGTWQEGLGFGDVLMSVPMGLLLGQIIGPATGLDIIRWTNIYMLASATSMLIYIILQKNLFGKNQEYFPFLVGMIAGLVVCYVLTVTGRVS